MHQLLALVLAIFTSVTPGQVLSQHIEYSFITPSPSPEPTATPTPSPTVTPTPTLAPTRTPTPTRRHTATPILATPSPTALPASPTPVTANLSRPVPDYMIPMFTEFSQKYSVDINLLEKIADCESHFNTGVVSSNGLYKGMFQYTDGTWASQRRAMNADPNPGLMFGARESIDTAAFQIAHSGPSAWPVCSR